MLFNGLFGVHLHGFLIIKVDRNDEISGCNLITGNKTKLLKHVRAGQLCKKHTLVVQNKKIIIIT